MKRLSKANVFVRHLSGRSSTSNVENGAINGYSSSSYSTSNFGLHAISQKNFDSDELDYFEQQKSQRVKTGNHFKIGQQQSTYSDGSSSSGIGGMLHLNSSTSTTTITNDSSRYGDGANSQQQHSSSSSSSLFSLRSPPMAQRTKQTIKTTSMDSDGLSSNSLLLDLNRVVRVFNMDKFKEILERESQLARPNHLLLRNMCITVVSFVLDDRKLLNLPSWIMVINMVAMDLLIQRIGLPTQNEHYHKKQTPALIRQHQLLLSANKKGDNDAQAYHGRNYRPDAASNGDFFAFRRRQQAHYRRELSRTEYGGPPPPAMGRDWSSWSPPPPDDYDDNDYPYRNSNNGNDHHHHHHQMDYRRRGLLAPNQKQHLFKCSTLNDTDANYVDCSNNTDDYYKIDEDASPSLEYLDERVGNSNDASKKSISKCDSNFQLMPRRPTVAGQQQKDNSNKELSSSSGDDDGANAPTRTNHQSQRSMFLSGTKLLVDASNGSSSSGFNSNYSLQNDNQISSPDVRTKATDNNQNSTTGSSVTSNSNSSFSATANEPEVVGSQMKPAVNLANNRLARGERPPKLPHGISSPTAAAAAAAASLVSDPIPIPAPPTSAGGLPSGKANLILVSPTGLSPPLPKKYDRNKTHSTFLGGNKSNSSNGGLNHDTQSGSTSSSTKSDDSLEARDIKPGRVLPAGIPAHAQLAPPATQRHILRYLMSAVTRHSNHHHHNQHKQQLNQQQLRAKGLLGRNSNINNVQQQQQSRSFLPNNGTQAATVLANRLYRPLPVLPNQAGVGYRIMPSSQKPFNSNQHPQKISSDESLYYSGLQARVPKHNNLVGPHHSSQKLSLAPSSSDAKIDPANTKTTSAKTKMQLTGYQYPITKSAIDSILSDFKLEKPNNGFTYAQHYREQQQQQLKTNKSITTTTNDGLPVKPKRTKQTLSSLTNLKLLSSSASALVQNGFRSKKTSQQV